MENYSTFIIARFAIAKPTRSTTVGKSYRNKPCSQCPEIGRVIESWGEFYCPQCYENRQRGFTQNQNALPGIGHPDKIPVPGTGGIIAQDIDLDEFRNFDAGVTFERCGKNHPVFATLYLEHYPNSRGIMGRQINYLIRFNGEVAGIIGANSPPLNYKLFRQFFETDDENSFLNNNVFRLIRHDKNLGTRVLAIFRRLVSIDYRETYGDENRGFVTFVEPPRSGTIYRADNWKYLGMTQGMSVQKRVMNDWENKEWSAGTKKHIYVIKHRNDQRDLSRHISAGAVDDQLPLFT